MITKRSLFDAIRTRFVRTSSWGTVQCANGGEGREEERGKNNGDSPPRHNKKTLSKSESKKGGMMGD
jgi:hypothetical protein